MRQKVAAALVAAVVLTLTLALGGCGSSQQQTETVSSAQAVRRLGAACVAGEVAARREPRTGNPQETFVKSIQTNMKVVMDEIGNLKVTGTARAPFAAYTDSVRKRLVMIEQILEADPSELLRAIRAQGDRIGVQESRGHDAIVTLGARHDCL